MKKATKRFTAFAVVMMLVVSCFPITAFAGTWGIGDHYLGYCNITDKPNHLGGSHVFNGNYMQLKPAWKPLDDASKEVDMYMEVRDITCGGKVVYQHRFTISEDADGRKDNGYWYAESGWFKIDKGHTFKIFYEPYTSTGYTGTGSNRKATCVLYANVGN